jgi:hypothetical protein
MRDDLFKGGSFGREDRRVLRTCSTGGDAEEAARYALSAEFRRQVGDLPQRLASGMAGMPWMVEEVLDRTIQSEVTPGALRYGELVRALVVQSQPLEGVLRLATEQMLADDAAARANKFRHHAAMLAGPGARDARALARRAEAAFGAAANDPDLPGRLARGEAVARPKKRPVNPDEVIA